MATPGDVTTEADGFAISANDRLIDLLQFVEYMPDLRATPSRHSRGVDGEVTAARLK